MNITEDKLKAAIQIALGMRGIYTEEIESALVHHVKALSIDIVSNTFKAQIQSDIEEAKRTLKSTKENTTYSFEDASGWVEEMNLMKGEIQGLTKALNYC